MKMGHQNPPKDERYKTLRITTTVYEELWEYCQAYRRRHGKRLFMLDLVESVWENYKKSAGIDPTGVPPIAVRDGAERRFVTTALSAIRDLPEAQRAATMALLLRLLAATPDSVATEQQRKLARK